MPGSEFIRVTARVRPSASAVPQERVVNVIDSRNICFNSKQPVQFKFDAVFDETDSQERVFEKLASRIIDGCVDGFNGTIFAYGQTGSGKTHTMLGPPQVDNFLFHAEHRGLIPRACDALFTKLCTRAAEKGDNFKYSVTCKFVELYNEDFYDLVSTSQQKLTIRSDSAAVQLLGVSEHTVNSSADMMKILEIGWDSRRTAETAMNRESSRSHAIFIVDIKTEELINTIVNKKSATLNLVDLAGSERQTQAKTAGDRLREAININLSLTVLARVIRILSQPSRRVEHVPYRDSKLTHILRDSLGGNSRTAVIVNLHPDKRYYSDTLSTLQFSAACRKIENRIHVNEDLSGDTVMAFKTEISRLRAELQTVHEIYRAEHVAKMSEIEEELNQWKETAMARERQLVETRLQRDLYAAQLPSSASPEREDGVIEEMMAQLSGRIESVKTFQELKRVQLEQDLSSALRELDQMRVRLQNSEAARKALSEKYNNILKGFDGTLSGSPLRRLNSITPERRATTSFSKTPAQLRKERRQTMYTPSAGCVERYSRAFKPVLFEEAEDGGDVQQENVELESDLDMMQERELMRLEMDNNRLTQKVDEKEAKIEEIYKSQKVLANKWMEEKEELLRNMSSFKSQVEEQQLEITSLQNSLEESNRKADLLSAKILTFNDEKTQLLQEIDKLRSDKYDHEDRLQAAQNELEQMLTEMKNAADLELANTDLRDQLHASQQKNITLQSKISSADRDNGVLKEQLNDRDAMLAKLQAELSTGREELTSALSRIGDLERECSVHSEVLRFKEEEASSTAGLLHDAVRKNEDFLGEIDRLKGECEQLCKRNINLKNMYEGEIDRLKGRHSEDLKRAENLAEMERSAHEMTKRKFSEFCETTQQTFERTIEEIQNSYSTKERSLTSDLEQQIVRMNLDMEILRERCSRLEEEKMALRRVKEELEKTLEEVRINAVRKQKELEATLEDTRAIADSAQEEVENTKMELELLQNAKAEDDRAIAELAGHHNSRQKINYLTKLRLELYNLKQEKNHLEAEVKRLRGSRTNSPARVTGPATRSRSARGTN